jgi:hypothetical protein
MGCKKFIMGILIIIMVLTFTACSGCNRQQAAMNSTEPEGTTATQKMTVTVKDKDGIEKVVEGVAIIDESGKATITVKDNNGNDLVISGTAAVDENGKATIKDITIDNNDQDITVSVEPTSTEAPTETPTEASTQAPTEAQTEAPTQVTTEAPTQAPTNPAANNCPYQLYVKTTRYIENGRDGSKEYIGYYSSNDEQCQEEINIAMEFYTNGYINNMWVNVGDYDDHSKVTFVYYWK